MKISLRSYVPKITMVTLSVTIMGLSIFMMHNSICSEERVKSHASGRVKKPELIGEVIIYDVQLGRMNVGKAIFRHLPKTELKGKAVNLMTFETKLARFSDVEKIYSDPDTFLPIKIERYVSTWPQPERITEDYNQRDFVLSIKKSKGKREENIRIKKDGFIHNAILLPYYVRNTATLAIGYSMLARLPTQEFRIKLIEKESVTVPSGKFIAYHFESTPKKFEVWITADERRIPIKIKGASGIGYTLVMKEYSLKK